VTGSTAALVRLGWHRLSAGNRVKDRGCMTGLIASPPDGATAQGWRIVRSEAFPSTHNESDDAMGQGTER